MPGRCWFGLRRKYGRRCLPGQCGRERGINNGAGPPAPQRLGHGHAEDVVLLGQRQQLIVEFVFEVAQLFVRADFFAEGVDVVEELLLFFEVHDNT